MCAVQSDLERALALATPLGPYCYGDQILFQVRSEPQNSKRLAAFCTRSNCRLPAGSTERISLCASSTWNPLKP